MCMTYFTYNNLRSVYGYIPAVFYGYFTYIILVVFHSRPMEELDPGRDLTYSERPVKILDTAKRVTCRKVIRMCKY
jgi:hypothetical protein